MARITNIQPINVFFFEECYILLLKIKYKNIKTPKCYRVPQHLSEINLIGIT